MINRAPCDMSEAGIYRHFENKHDLYATVIRRKTATHDISRLLEILDTEDSIEGVLRGVAELILGYLETDPELLRLMFNNSLESAGVRTRPTES